jgi:alpha-1,6-mannosyltransferase
LISPRTLPLLVTVALLLTLEGAGLLTQPEHQARWFVLAVLGQGLVFLLVVTIWRRDPARIGLGAVLIVAALLRLGPLLAPVTWSNDINRYVWDGRVQNAGINPYCCLPVDESLALLRDDTVWTNINRPDTARTIYPPVAQMVFALAVSLHDSIFAMKLAMLVAESLGIWAMVHLLRRTGRPPSQLLLYAWHPLPAWEIAGSGHVDALVVAFVSLALLAAVAGQRGWAGVAFGAAVLTKFLPVILGPAMWRPRRGQIDWRFPLAGIVTVLGLYLPYLSVGARVIGYLPGYADEEKLSASSGGGFWPVEALQATTGLVLPGGVYLAGAGLVMVGLGIAALFRPDGDTALLNWSTVLAAALLVLLSPHYAWYFVWVLVPAALAGMLPVLWLSLTAILLYWPDPGGIPVWVGGVIYGGFLTWSATVLLRRRRTR